MLYGFHIICAWLNLFSFYNENRNTEKKSKKKIIDSTAPARKLVRLGSVKCLRKFCEITIFATLTLGLASQGQL